VIREKTKLLGKLLPILEETREKYKIPEISPNNINPEKQVDGELHPHPGGLETSRQTIKSSGQRFLNT
jgi:hypothetical protein